MFNEISWNHILLSRILMNFILFFPIANYFAYGLHFSMHMLVDTMKIYQRIRLAKMLNWLLKSIPGTNALDSCLCNLHKFKTMHPKIISFNIRSSYWMWIVVRKEQLNLVRNRHRVEMCAIRYVRDWKGLGINT